MKREVKFGRVAGYLPRPLRFEPLIGRVAPWAWLLALALFFWWVR